MICVRVSNHDCKRFKVWKFRILTGIKEIQWNRYITTHVRMLDERRFCEAKIRIISKTVCAVLACAYYIYNRSVWQVHIKQFKSVKKTAHSMPRRVSNNMLVGVWCILGSNYSYRRFECCFSRYVVAVVRFEFERIIRWHLECMGASKDDRFSLRSIPETSQETKTATTGTKSIKFKGIRRIFHQPCRNLTDIHRALPLLLCSHITIVAQSRALRKLWIRTVFVVFGLKIPRLRKLRVEWAKNVTHFPGPGTFAC